MRPLPTRTPQASRRTRATAVLGALATALVVLTGPAAGAAPLSPADPAAPPAGSSELRAEVARLTAEVEQLEVAAEVAVEDYNEVAAELDALSAQEVQAQVALDAAGRELHADRTAATQRVRALYRSGGTVEIAWTALSGSGFAQAATTYRTARVVLDSDARTVERARDRVDVAVDTSGAVQDLRRERAVLEVEAGTRRVRAETALLARESLLAGAGTALATAVEQERVEAERVALERALAAAREAAAARAAEQARAAALAGAAAGALDGAGAAARAQAAAQDSAGAAGPGGGTVVAGTVGSDQRAVLDRAAAAAPTPAAAAAIRAAGSRLGLPYTWGATGPGTFDCSGLTMWAYRQAGVSIPRTSRQQYAGLPTVDVGSLLPGDLVFYAHGSAPGSIHHVSIWLGDGLILTAPRTGDVVKISPVWRQPLYGAVRPTG